MKKIFIVFILIFLGAGCGSRVWVLSLYRDGSTLMRVEYPSKADCISAAKSYEKDKTMDRYDCSYNCDGNVNDLSQSLLCEQVCNDDGCR